MTTRKFQLPVSGFIKGLNTEASPLSILPSEFMDGTVNVELLNNGEARRRRGVDFIGQSNSGNFLHTIRTGLVVDELIAEAPVAVWVKITAPNGDLLERVIFDLDNSFKIYRADRASLLNFDFPDQTIDRDADFTTDQRFYTMQFAQSGNRVYFAGRHINPGYLKVASDNLTLEVTYFDVIIRDETANLDTGDKVTNLTGVGDTRWFDCVESHTSTSALEPGVGTGDWKRYWHEIFVPVPVSSPPAPWANSTAYTTAFIKRYSTDNSGSSTQIHPTAIAFFAGRLWLSGDPVFPNEVLFSQTIQDPDEEIQRYYQTADPFDAADPDLVATDGGVIAIQGAGQTFELIDTANSMFVGTSKGIFQIFGPAGVFAATDFAQVKVLDERIESADNIVRVGQEIMIFGANSIWLSQIERNLTLSTAGEAAFIDMVEDKIDTLYSGISRNNKSAARAVYDGSGKRVYYFFNKDQSAFASDHNRFNQPLQFTHVLVIDVRFLNRNLESLIPKPQGVPERTTSGAFFLYEFADTANDAKPYIGYPFIMPKISVEGLFVEAEGAVVDGIFENVVDDLGNRVVVTGPVQNEDAVAILVMRHDQGATQTQIQGGLAVLAGPNTIDWSSDVTYATSTTSLIKFGYQTGGDVLHKKGPTYIFFVFKKVETGVLVNNVDTNPGGALFRTASNFAQNTNSSLYGSAKQIYFPDRIGYAKMDGGDDGFNHTWFKHRIRGRHHVQQFTLESDGDKDFHLVGWNNQFWGKID